MHRSTSLARSLFSRFPFTSTTFRSIPRLPPTPSRPTLPTRLHFTTKRHFDPSKPKSATTTTTTTPLPILLRRPFSSKFSTTMPTEKPSTLTALSPNPQINTPSPPPTSPTPPPASLSTLFQNPAVKQESKSKVASILRKFVWIIIGVNAVSALIPKTYNDVGFFLFAGYHWLNLSRTLHMRKNGEGKRRNKYYYFDPEWLHKEASHSYLNEFDKDAFPLLQLLVKQLYTGLSTLRELAEKQAMLKSQAVRVLSRLESYQKAVEYERTNGQRIEYQDVEEDIKFVKTILERNLFPFVLIWLMSAVVAFNMDCSPESMALLPSDEKAKTFERVEQTFETLSELNAKLFAQLDTLLSLAVKLDALVDNQIFIYEKGKVPIDQMEQPFLLPQELNEVYTLSGLSDDKLFDLVDYNFDDFTFKGDHQHQQKKKQG